MMDPVKYLMEKHRSNSNYGQALGVYGSQCRKESWILEVIRKAHKELVDKGFMVPLESLDRETVKFIQEAQFCHYYLWRVVNKTDSLSTPVWLVVDPTMSSLGQRGEPTTFVMIRAWYGVTPRETRLATAWSCWSSLQLKSSLCCGAPHPTPVRGRCAFWCRRPDPEGRADQPEYPGTGRGGFKFKYVIRSGEDPPEGASSNGESCK